MIPRFTIAFDVDGTTADLHTVWLDRYNNDYGDNLKVSDIKAWEIHRFVKPECGKHIYDYLQDPSIYDDVKPIDNCLEVIDRLRDIADVIHVTHSTSGHKGRKLRWLMEHGLMIAGDRYIEQEDKSSVPAHFLLDDYDKNVRDFKGQGVLLSQSWNQDATDLQRVSTWDDFYYYIKDSILFYRGKKEYVYALR